MKHDLHVMSPSTRYGLASFLESHGSDAKKNYIAPTRAGTKHFWNLRSNVYQNLVGVRSYPKDPKDPPMEGFLAGVVKRSSK